jgi:hypothetical protein
MRTKSIAPGYRSTVKRLFPALLLLSVLLTGCARNYVITMTNGARVTARSKPKLQGAYYVFRDAKGEPAQVSAGRVREIAPASMAKEEGSQFLK